MERLTNKAIAKALKETGSMIDLTGGNPFKSRAYQNGARTLERLEASAYDLVADNTLTEAKGIGKSIARDIAELIDTGSLKSRDSLLGAIPPGLRDLLRIKGLGAKKVRQLWKEEEITNLDELESAAKSGSLDEVKGFGSKLGASIITNIAFVRSATKQRRLANAVTALQDFTQALNCSKISFDFTGQVRRQLSVVDSVEILIAKNAKSSTLDIAEQYLLNISDNDSVIKAESQDGFPVEISFIEEAKYGSMLFESSATPEFLKAFSDKFELGEFSSEEALFAEHGIPAIHPALRDNESDFNLALGSEQPDLIEVKDLRGTLHNHSKYSDGAHSLLEMVEESRNMGLSYFGICDHSKSLQVANGLSAERVGEQQIEIQQLNDGFDKNFKIFSGIESDILGDGSLDYDDEILASFDFIVASVHSGFNMSQDEATARLIRAIENPHTRILGHPTGRVLLSRPGYAIDHKKVIDACAANGVAIELNASPYRLDIDWTWIPYSISKGVLIAINPDAHSIQDLHCWEWGVRAAQKGRLTKEFCLNALESQEFQDWINRS